MMLEKAQRRSSLSPGKRGRARARAGLHGIALTPILSRKEREKRQVEP
jgi:hypothetical protein